MFHKTWIMACAILGYCAGTTSLAAVIVFLSGRVPAFSVDGGTVPPVGVALAINAALMAQWTAQHIGMARQGFKQWLRKRLPEALERSNYMLFTGASLWLVLIAWSPMPGQVFTLTHPAASVAVSALFVTGWLFAIAGIAYDSYPEFVGLRQAWRHVRGSARKPTDARGS